MSSQVCDVCCMCSDPSEGCLEEDDQLKWYCYDCKFYTMIEISKIQVQQADNVPT